MSHATSPPPPPVLSAPLSVPLKKAPPPANPEESAGFLSLMFMSWLNDFVITGYSRPLTVADALPLHSRDVPSSQYNRFVKHYTGSVYEAGEASEASIAATAKDGHGEGCE